MGTDNRPISDQLKQVVDDLHLEERVRDLAATAEEAVLRGLAATGSYLREHRAEIDGFLDRAGSAIDRQTSGRFSDQVDQVRSQLSAGIATIADREWGSVAGSDRGLPPPMTAPDAGDAWSDATDH